MFTRTSTASEPIPLPGRGPTARPSFGENHAPEIEQPRTATASVIGTDLSILGEQLQIISQDSLQIDGNIHGDVSGKKITIGTHGSVTGTISSEIVEVHGGVFGAVRAQSVVLHASAHVDGEILHQTLAISEGARFDGRVRHPKDPGELQPNLDIGRNTPSLVQGVTTGTDANVQSGEARSEPFAP